MTSHIAIIGGGITGLAAALFLARQGHRITLLEREARPLSPDLDADFLHWHRPATPQALQPHLLRAPIRTVLRAAAPDVYATLLGLGATEHPDLAAFGPSDHPGDEDLVTLRARRILLESALTRAVQAEPSITHRPGTTATGLLYFPGPAPHVMGVHTPTGDFRADLVLDAAGRRSPIHRWLDAIGARPAVTDVTRTGIAYFCRWYRSTDATTPDPPRAGCLTPYTAFGIFPADNDYFALAFTVAVNDPTRTALRDPATYDRAARLFPGGAAWLAQPHQPVTDVHAMAGLDNRWTALHDDKGPTVTGLLSIGDSAIHTNPTLGQGISLALLSADWLAHQDPTSPTLATDYHRWRLDTLRPWFDVQTTIDRDRRAELQASLKGLPPAPPPPDALNRAALGPCSADDLTVARARAQVAQMVRTPVQAYATPEIQSRVTAWLRANPEFTGPPPGPTRELWEKTLNPN
ncbi:NAD(P)/FAD-dependent oxidoreductase [Kitasatospora sp. NPDC006697]|uniref:NAD(P)/FAD-dependent oxidoreductase n=1 Tax=Kitasatospora sp. NPDC006697 TaxID=3364020 RepID=UPI003684E1BC